MQVAARPAAVNVSPRVHLPCSLDRERIAPYPTPFSLLLTPRDDSTWRWRLSMSMVLLLGRSSTLLTLTTVIIVSVETVSSERKISLDLGQVTHSNNG